jgi:hypothetical protein
MPRYTHRGVHRRVRSRVRDDEADGGGGEEDDGGKAVGTEQAHATASVF